jgi:hypothetical protein
MNESLTRAAQLRVIIARARSTGKQVFGFASTAKANCAEMPKSGVPVNWDRLCVEGDSHWTYVSLGADRGERENKAAAAG